MCTTQNFCKQALQHERRNAIHSQQHHFRAEQKHDYLLCEKAMRWAWDHNFGILPVRSFFGAGAGDKVVRLIVRRSIGFTHENCLPPTDRTRSTRQGTRKHEQHVGSKVKIASAGLAADPGVYAGLFYYAVPNGITCAEKPARSQISEGRIPSIDKLKAAGIRCSAASPGGFI